ncbi:MAG TPA: MoxR family ATPase [Polyangiaceae bacterium]|nr:MoxR family ATPase [Polyangiaceae bacterium]
MTNGLFFQPQVTVAPKVPVRLPGPVQMEASRPEDYVASPALVDAVNTALLIGQPLLLTGEPGTGKTQLASALAYQLGYPRPLRFEAKSNSQARDLFYHYDAVGHFRSRQEHTSILDFIRYAALGRAVLFANEPERVRKWLTPGMQHDRRSASVVLIDEVDKAPRDFPNDILVELEELSFRVTELDAWVQAPPDLRPVVVITSNSERDLPDAFLRRCVYYDIPFPDLEALRVILQKRFASVAGQAGGAFIQSALAVFQRIRALPELRRKPATAELIAWVAALARAYPGHPNPLSDRGAVEAKLGVLVKTREDLAVARRAVAGAGLGG